MNNRVFGVLCMVLLVLSVSVSVSAGYHEDKGCRECTLDLSDGGWLYILAGSETFYTWEDIGHGRQDDLYICVTAVNRPIILGRYVKVAGKTVEILYKSSDHAVLYPAEKGHFRVVGPGRATISIAAEDGQVDLPINVVPLPFREGANAKDVIDRLGLPDSQTRLYIPWPNSKSVDGIFYYRRDDGQGWLVQHWLYDAYPGLVLSLSEDGETVRAAHNLSWYTSYKEWALENL